MTRTPALALACFLVFTAVGCEHAPGYPPTPMQRPDAVSDFNTLFSQNCSACHGANGQGGPAIDLSNPEYQALVDDDTLRKWITDGMPGTEMPAFAQSAGGMLTDAQVNALVAGMRKAWSRLNAFAGQTPPPYAQTETGDASHGHAIYTGRCASCHRFTQDITDPDYLALMSDQALRSIMIAGRPDVGQPDWSHLGGNGEPAAPLSAQDVSDLVAYLGALRNGSSETQAANTVPMTKFEPSAQKGR